MKKRLRKKLFKGEFKELGFNVSFTYDAATTDDGYALLDEFIDYALSLGLCVGGYFGEDGCKASLFIVAAKRGSVTDEQRQAVAKWLGDSGKVSQLEVGELRDAWYGWGE